MTANDLPHLHQGSEGSVWIDETGYRVIDLAGEHLAHAWGAETLQENHPELSLAQIHAALAWFYDHEEETLEELARRAKRAEHILETRVSVATQQRLKTIKVSKGE